MVTSDALTVCFFVSDVMEKESDGEWSVASIDGYVQKSPAGIMILHPAPVI
ncbi:hypothetical protein [Paenibacillus sp. WLX2291]|uniref:hypothetical protein n=1 Tax=Paenibacillus sp. WLX2291 TaxID=3296934 RepID=UPI0039841876